jgi:hypothetical protein
MEGANVKGAEKAAGAVFGQAWHGSPIYCILYITLYVKVLGAAAAAAAAAVIDNLRALCTNNIKRK